MPKPSCQRVIRRKSASTLRKENKWAARGSFRSKMWDGKRLSRQSPLRKLTGPNVHNKENKHGTLSIYITTAQSRHPQVFLDNLFSLALALSRALSLSSRQRHQVRYLALKLCRLSSNYFESCTAVFGLSVEKERGTHRRAAHENALIHTCTESHARSMISRRKKKVN